MVLSDFYRRIQDGVLCENLDGTYIKQSPSQYAKTIIGLGIVNLALALSSFYALFGVNCTKVMYTDDLQQIVFLPKGINYLYIGVDGVYQNYLSYTKSISYAQLKGKTKNLNLSSTAPYDYSESGLPFYPAGAIAATYIQDEITIDGLEIETGDISRKADRNLIGITSYLPSQVEWPVNWTAGTNSGTKPLNTYASSGLPILSERFVNWITLSPFSNFKKLWGWIDVPESGEYRLTVFSKTKVGRGMSIIISERSTLGTQHWCITLGFVSISIFSIAIGLYLMRCGY